MRLRQLIYHYLGRPEPTVPACTTEPRAEALPPSAESHPDSCAEGASLMVEQEEFEERAAIMEYEAGLTRPEAERRARECVGAS